MKKLKLLSALSVFLLSLFFPAASPAYSSRIVKINIHNGMRGAIGIEAVGDRWFIDNYRIQRYNSRQIIYQGLPGGAHINVLRYRFLTLRTSNGIVLCRVTALIMGQNIPRLSIMSENAICQDRKNTLRMETHLGKKRIIGELILTVSPKNQ